MTIPLWDDVCCWDDISYDDDECIPQNTQQGLNIDSIIIRF